MTTDDCLSWNNFDSESVKFGTLCISVMVVNVFFFFHK